MDERGTLPQSNYRLKHTFEAEFHMMGENGTDVSRVTIKADGILLPPSQSDKPRIRDHDDPSPNIADVADQIAFWELLRALMKAVFAATQASTNIGRRPEHQPSKD